MDYVSACERAVGDASALIGAVGPGQLGAPTPCEDWDVRALTAHMTELCSIFADALGTPAPAAGRGEPAAAYEEAAAAMMRGWRVPGAVERTLAMPWGEMPAMLGAQLLIGDHLIHAWDLARALGRPYAMDEELAAGTLEMMKGMLTPEMRGAVAGFAAAVPCPEDAPVQDQLIAFSGRRPRSM